MSAKKPANKKLSALEKELLEYAKKGQPVLLYGKDTCGRGGLINRIHLLNGGINSSWEYTGSERSIKSFEDIYDARTKALEEQDTKKAEGFLQDCKDTLKTSIHVDCDFKGGKEVMDILCNYSELFRGGGLFSSEKEDEIRGLLNQLNSSANLLFWFGLVFVDNLRCTRNDSKDEEWYMRFAEKIKLRIISDGVSASWLVAYTYDHTTFPQYFLDQFKLVPLDGEEAVIKEKQPERKRLKATCLWLGEPPDRLFYAIVNGKKKPIGKLSEKTQAYTILHTLYNLDTKKASFDELISKCKIQKLKRGNHVPGRKKKNLQTIISKLNSILFDVFHIEHIVKPNDSTEEYYLDIECRDGMWTR